jgi:hypothetical protein
MHRKPRTAVSAFICFAAIWLADVQFAFAQNFRPFTPLRTIATEHFDIVFPEASRLSAESLAAAADGIYDRISALLKVAAPRRIPVAITPDTAEFNAYCAPLPYQHIVLYDTPIDPEWTALENPFLGVFTHELVHALSGSVRGAATAFLERIFGAWIAPVALTAPEFMIEGVTVSFESLDGFGRANDPLVKQRLRQALRENAFLTPFQTAGVYDRPGSGRAHYEYGGLFSKYLQDRFGMAAYAGLWKSFGSRYPLAFDFKRSGFHRIFADVYGESLDGLWADFAASLVLTGLEDNRAGTVLGGERRMLGLDAANGRLYWIDTLDRELASFDPSAGVESSVLRLDGAATDFDVADDGKSVLISGYRRDGELATATVVEYALPGGRPTGRRWSGLSSARYFRDGIVGIGADRHLGRLVFRDGGGGERVLLAGGETLGSSRPAPLDADRIAVTVLDRGIRRLVVYGWTSGTAVELADPGAGDARLAYMRGLAAADGRLVFVYDDDDRFYKLAAVEWPAGGEATAVFSNRDFSGGVSVPVRLGGSVYYQAEYVEWDALMRFPEAGAGLSGERVALAVRPWPAAAAEVTGGLESAPAAGFRERGYSALAYLNPFACWLPVPLVRVDATGLRLDGGGIVSLMQDPTDTHGFSLTAGGDAYGRMGYFEAVFTTTGLGWPITLAVSDGLVAAAGSGGLYRLAAAEVQFDLERGFGGERWRLGFAPRLRGAFTAMDPGDGSSAYSWPIDEPVAVAGATLELTDWDKPAWSVFGRGFDAAAGISAILPDGLLRYEGLARLGAAGPLPARFTVYAVKDESGIGVDGRSKAYGAAVFAGQALSEYAAEISGAMPWLAGGEAEFRIFAVEVQANLSHLYVNRLFGSVGYRAALLPLADGGAGLVHSLFARAGATVSAIPVAIQPFRYSPFVAGYLKLSDLKDTDPGNDFGIGFGLNFEW